MQNPTGGADDYLVERGYIDVVMDVRGTGDSGGQWGLFDPIQQQDAIKVVDWCAHLAHSDGKVGTYGPSYLGIDQLLLAGAIGPHSPLKAIFPMVAANDIYRDTSFMGGLVDFEFDEAYLGLVAGLDEVNPVTDTASDPQLLADLAGIELDHTSAIASYDAATEANVLSGGSEAYDGTYWQERNPVNILAKIVANGIPAYLIGGELDLFQNGEHTGMGRTPTPLHYYDLGTGTFDETTTYPFAGAHPTTFSFGAGRRCARASRRSQLPRPRSSGAPRARRVAGRSTSGPWGPSRCRQTPSACADADNTTQIGPQQTTYTTPSPGATACG